MIRKNFAFELPIAMKCRSNTVKADGSPIRFVKLLLPVIGISICYTYHVNHCMMTTDFPELRKYAIVLTVHLRSRTMLVADVKGFGEGS